jgi:hypothetical protein
LTQADLGRIRDILSELRVAIDFTTGTTRSFANARINTRRQFTGRGRA